MMLFFKSRSLLLGILVGIGIVVMILMSVRFASVYNYIKDAQNSNNIEHLREYTEKIALVESQVFLDAEKNIQFLSKLFIDEIQKIKENHQSNNIKDIPSFFLEPKSTIGLSFDKKFIKATDGVTRRRLDNLDILNESNTYIDKNINLTPENKQIALLQHNLSSYYGRAWSQQFISTFIVSLDGIYSNYWANVNWNREGVPENNFYALTWASLLDKKNNPSRKPLWTEIWFDRVSGGWLSNCVIPIDLNQQFRFYIGTSIRMNEVAQRLSKINFNGSKTIVLSQNGDLISHPTLLPKIEELNGKFNVKKSYDTYLYDLYKLVNTNYAIYSNMTSVLYHEKYDEYLIVSRIQGPDWYFISVYPRPKMTTSSIQQDVIIPFLINILELISILFLVSYLLRKKIIQPLHELRNIATQITSGHLDVTFPKNYKFELKELSSAFETMIRSIQERDSKLIEANKQLEESNQLLESKVLNRTTEVNSQNLNLQQEIQAREILNEIITSERSILELIVKHQPLSQILAKICGLVEKQLPNSICCILLLDEQQKHLLIGASPKLPELFLQKLHHAPVKENHFSCSTAVYLGQRVIAKDIKNNMLWDNHLKMIAYDFKLQSCFSTPIVAIQPHHQSKILGSISLYYKASYYPLEKDFNVIDRIMQLCAIAIERDVVEHKLQDSEEMYRTIFESVNDAILLLGANNGGIVDANVRASFILGYSIDELKKFKDLGFLCSLVNSNDEYTSTKAWQHFQMSLMGQSQIFEWRFPLKNGGFSWIEINLKQAFINSQIMILAVIRDINQRKLSEKLLKDSEENYRAIFDFANDAILVHDAETGKIIDANQKAIELQGYSLEELKESSNYSCLCPQSKDEYNSQKYLEYLSKALNEGEQLFEWQSCRKDGQFIWQEISLKKTNIHGHNRILAVIRDISERKHSQLLIEEQNESLVTKAHKLEQLNQDKNEFLGIAAHDLKNPLNTILMTADMLIEEYDDFSKDETITYLNQVKHGSNRMLMIINELLDINRIESGNLPVKLRCFNIGGLVKEICSSYKKRADLKQISLQIDVPKQLNAFADSNATYEIIENLISNAIKYSEPKKDVFIKLEEISEKSLVRLSVKDNGPGISEKEQQQLFKRFMKLSARPTGGEHSTGLGLSIVKKLIEAMNGTVRCESKLGEGANFIIELPTCSS